jgi:hypothetical protein
MKPLGARTGRRTLASTSCLLLLAGLSCKYNVTLPWVPDDGSTRAQDSSFDQSPLSSPDLPLHGPEVVVCPGNNTRELNATRSPAQIIVAIDRSASMQKEFDSSTKTQAAVSALSYSIEHHPGLSFPTLWFPGTNCGGPVCCANVLYNPGGGRGNPDVPWVCGPSDAGCQPPSNDSPSHQALRQANANFNNGTWWALNSTLVLITDQNPSCAGESISENSLCNTAITEAGKVAEASVRTFVMVPIADGRSSVPDCLNKIANKFPDAQQPIPIRNSQEMRSQLEYIVSGIEEKRSCRFYIQQEMDQIEQVRINGVSIPRDDTGKMGWSLVNGAIVLSTEACEEITNTAKPDVKVVLCNSGRGQGSYGP